MKELGDRFASPAGWHALPCSNDPSVGEHDKAMCGKFSVGALRDAYE